MENTVITMTIIHKTSDHQIISLNPTVIPRKGDRVMCNYTPAPTVTEVVWDYGEGTNTDTKITVMLN